MGTFNQARHSGLVLLSLFPLLSLEEYIVALERQFEYKSIANSDEKTRFLQGWRAAWYSQKERRIP